LDDHCIICDHPRSGHWGAGCHRSSFLRGDCGCDFVEQPPLPSDATATQYRGRAEWWRQRIRMTDDHIRRTSVDSDQRRRLERFRDLAITSERRALEAAERMDAAQRREGSERGTAIAGITSARQVTDAERQRRELLASIEMASIAKLPPRALGLLQAQFDTSLRVERQEVLARVERQFNDLEPSYRRQLLEDEDVLAFLEHIGVVSHWSIGTVNRRLRSTTR
jgi:hypothetical protein